MSTQEAVTPAAKAAPNAAQLAIACWLWLFGVVGGAVLAWALGGSARPLAMAAALAIAPALAGFMLLPRLGGRIADLGFIAIWLIVAMGLTAGTGGVGSPLAAAFAIPPALAVALARPWAAEAGAAAVLGFAAAAGIALLDGGDSDLGALPEILAVAALALAAGLMAIGQAQSCADRSAAARQVAEVSHELRTPLTHILGFAEMIERRMFGDIGERYVEYAGLIRRSGAHLLELVNDLLDLGKIDAGRYALTLEEFDARDLAAEIVRLSANAAAKREIALGLVTPPAPLLVRADHQALRRMMENVLGNALKFTPEGGRVMVSLADAAGVLRLDVADSGPGIPESERGALGQAYRQGAARVGGTGLGLSLVRGLAQLHGGALSFHDAPDGGALVRIELPVLAKGG